MSFETVSEESRLLRKTALTSISPIDSKPRPSATNLLDSSGSTDQESRHLQINTYLKKLHDRGLFSWRM